MFFDILAKLESSLGDNFGVTLPFGVFVFLGGADFQEKKVLYFFVAFWSEPGPGSARNGFLAKNYVGLTKSQPKRLSGRPFRGQNVFYGKNLTLIRFMRR